MSDLYAVSETNFFVPAADVPAMKEAVKQYIEATYDNDEHGTMDAPTKIENTLWKFAYDEAGNCIYFHVEEEKYVDDVREQLNAFLAKYVREGDFIELTSESGEKVRIVFKNGEADFS